MPEQKESCFKSTLFNYRISIRIFSKEIFIFREGWFEALLDQEQRREDGQLSRARPLETESAIPCPHPSIRCSASAHIHISTYNWLWSAVHLFVHLSIRLSASKDGSLPSRAHILVSGVPPRLTFTSVHITGSGQLSVCLFIWPSRVQSMPFRATSPWHISK